jgi:hypothetical protein
VTITEPTPAFRRFPWIQLVFCLACLTMTAWTWMRYSYAWEVTPRTMLESGTTPLEGPWAGRYVSVFGRFAMLTSENGGSSRGFIVEDTADLSPLEAPRFALSVRPNQIPALPKPGEYTFGPVRAWKGRMSSENRIVRIDSKTGRADHEECTMLDMWVSRFHGASIAGLIVGAMGVFIFGLYLRSWLRERKTLACEPPQDMIV